MCYQAGAGVEKDLPKAVELFRQAVEGGRCVHVEGEATGVGYVFTLVALKRRQRTGRLFRSGMGVVNSVQTMARCSRG